MRNIRPRPINFEERLPVVFLRNKDDNAEPVDANLEQFLRAQEAEQELLQSLAEASKAAQVRSMTLHGDMDERACRPCVIVPVTWLEAMLSMHAEVLAVHGNMHGCHGHADIEFSQQLRQTFLLVGISTAILLGTMKYQSFYT